MKKLIIILLTAFLFQINKLNAQITLDHEVDSLDLDISFKNVQISPTETKYYFADTINNIFSLYNMDFTPFLLNISVPDPFNSASSGGFQVLYLTRALFDCDTSNIEYAYYAPYDINKPFRIMRTDGSLLFFSDSTIGPYCFGCRGGTDDIRPVFNSSAGTKLILQKYNLTSYDRTYIYSLCGTLPESVFDFTNMNQSLVKIFPNPSSGTLTFQINLPDNINEYELVIVDNNAKEITREKINSSFDKHVIDVSSLSSGHYFYSICTKNKTYQSGKFVLTK